MPICGLLRRLFSTEIFLALEYWRFLKFYYIRCFACKAESFLTLDYCILRFFFRARSEDLLYVADKFSTMCTTLYRCEVFQGRWWFSIFDYLLLWQYKKFSYFIYCFCFDFFLGELYSTAFIHAQKERIHKPIHLRWRIIPYLKPLDTNDRNFDFLNDNWGLHAEYKYFFFLFSLNFFNVRKNSLFRRKHEQRFFLRVTDTDIPIYWLRLLVNLFQVYKLFLCRHVLERFAWVARKTTKIMLVLQKVFALFGQFVILSIYLLSKTEFGGDIPELYSHNMIGTRIGT